MKSLRVATDGVGNPRLESLALPFVCVGPTMTDEDRLRMPRPELAREYRSFRAVRHSDGESQASSEQSTRHLVFVVSGSVQVSGPDATAVMHPGDVLFVDDLASTGHTISYRGDCQLVEVDVSDSWTPEGTVPPGIDDGQRDAEGAANIKEMFVADDQAHFRDFPSLFATASGATSSRPINGLSMICLSPGSFGDWHTEQNVSLVMVLSGGFELEVGGGSGAVEVFRAGDVCLVQDHHGQGHISRTHGETRFAAIAIPEDHTWE